MREDLGLTASEENEQDKFKLAKSLIPCNVKTWDGSQPEGLMTGVEAQELGHPCGLSCYPFGYCASSLSVCYGPSSL